MQSGTSAFVHGQTTHGSWTPHSQASTLRSPTSGRQHGRAPGAIKWEGVGPCTAKVLDGVPPKATLLSRSFAAAQLGTLRVAICPRPQWVRRKPVLASLRRQTSRSMRAHVRRRAPAFGPHYLRRSARWSEIVTFRMSRRFDTNWIAHALACRVASFREAVCALRWRQSDAARQRLGPCVEPRDVVGASPSRALVPPRGAAWASWPHG